MLWVNNPLFNVHISTAVLGCPCLRIDGFDLEEMRYSQLNGIWVIQRDTFNDRPYYIHKVSRLLIYM